MILEPCPEETLPPQVHPTLELSREVQWEEEPPLPRGQTVTENDSEAGVDGAGKLLPQMTASRKSVSLVDDLFSLLG